jgi:protein-tyrosine-phosphatase
MSTSMAAFAILMAGTAIGLQYMDIGTSRNATSQKTVSVPSDGDRSAGQAEPRQIVPVLEERKLAETRRQAEQAQQREAEQMGMILALRHDEQQAPAEARPQPDRERQAHQPGQQHTAVEQRASPEQKVAEAPRQAGPQHAARGERRKLTDAPKGHALQGARPKTARQAHCAASCRAKAAKRRAGASTRRTAQRSPARSAIMAHFDCPFLGRLHAALVELTAPAPAATSKRRTAQALSRGAVVVR